LKKEEELNMAISNSITLSDDLLRQIDQIVDQPVSRSEFIEQVLRQYLVNSKRSTQESRDLDIINRNADRLNQEAEDVLAYQVSL
jgi:metal-responsive CopG/Arc/MetJ family transcriptional regulator